MRLIPECHNCKKKNITEISRLEIGSKNFITWSCSHITVENKIQPVAVGHGRSLKDGRILYPFQNEGVKFLEANNGRGLINDDTGLGKTIQYVAFAGLHQETLPALIVCKATLLYQWQKEFVTGTGKFAQIMESKSGMLPASAYIVSYDTLAREPKWLEKLEYKTVVLDECQAIKSHNAKRTQKVRDACRNRNHIVLLSATPIKNNAGEFFPAMNLLNPGRFSNLRDFIYSHINYVWDGYRHRLGGLRHPQEWKEKNKDIILRRTREEVMPELPKIQRIHKYFPLGKEIESAFNVKLAEMYENLNEDEIETQSLNATSNLMQYLAQMRHITGFAKVDPAIEYIDEILDANPTTKITVFTHHIDVADILQAKLELILNIQSLRIKSEHSPEKRYDVIEAFKKPENHILICPTLSAGEGLNLQFCEHAIILEREWNPANEEQAEGRFPRIGIDKSIQSIEVFYPVALESVDEYLAEIVERKRQYIGETLDGKAMSWDQSSIMKEIGFKLLDIGRKRWRDKKKV